MLIRVIVELLVVGFLGAGCRRLRKQACCLFAEHWGAPDGRRVYNQGMTKPMGEAISPETKILPFAVCVVWYGNTSILSACEMLLVEIVVSTDTMGA